MDQAKTDALVKLMREKGYNVELEPTPSDDEIIKSLQDAGYVVTKDKDKGNDKTDTDTKPELNEDVVAALKQYGFEPVKQTEKGSKDETKDDKKQTSKQETKSAEETETKSNGKPSTDKQVMFLLGTPNQSSGDTQINEDTISVMTPEQIKENMPEIKEYILANGGTF